MPQRVELRGPMTVGTCSIPDGRTYQLTVLLRLAYGVTIEGWRYVAVR